MRPFASAREPDEELIALYIRQRGRESEQSALAVVSAVSARLADVDPVDPLSDNPSPLWLIPGIGGHARRILADRLLVAVGRVEPDGARRLPADLPEHGLLKAWKYGYYLRALEENGALK